MIKKSRCHGEYSERGTSFFFSYDFTFKLSARKINERKIEEAYDEFIA